MKKLVNVPEISGVPVLGRGIGLKPVLRKDGLSFIRSHEIHEFLGVFRILREGESPDRNDVNLSLGFGDIDLFHCFRVIEILEDECGFTLENVAQCVAILSPQVDWDTNKRNAVLIATTLDTDISIFASAKQKNQAVDALMNVYRIPETAQKIFSFADNIANPESLRVTVDRHAVGVALNDKSADRLRVTSKRYRELQAAYQDVARLNGLMPYQVQAITWLTYKRTVNR